MILNHDNFLDETYNVEIIQFYPFAKYLKNWTVSFSTRCTEARHKGWALPPYCVLPLNKTYTHCRIMWITSKQPGEGGWILTLNDHTIAMKVQQFVLGDLM